MKFKRGNENCSKEHGRSWEKMKWSGKRWYWDRSFVGRLMRAACEFLCNEILLNFSATENDGCHWGLVGSTARCSALWFERPEFEPGYVPHYNLPIEEMVFFHLSFHYSNLIHWDCMRGILKYSKPVGGWNSLTAKAHKNKFVVVFVLRVDHVKQLGVSY